MRDGQYNEPMTVPAELYSVAQVRGFDARAIASQGVDGYTLMQRAGDAALRLLRAAWPDARRIAIACGGGNNGGDGYVLARLLRAVGLEAQVHALVPPERLAGEARRACDDFLASGGALQASALPDPRQCELIVDALLGTGFRGALRAPFDTAVAALNASGRPILALDIPSGLDGDTGRVGTDAVRATRTISFVALKQGLCLEQGPERCGVLDYASLGVALPAQSDEPPQWRCLGETDLRQALPRRARDAHKGRFGHVLLIGGNHGMLGAARLAGEAALRVGAGLVSVATRSAHAAQLAATRPELMCAGSDEAGALQSLLARCTVVGIGPGLGQDQWARTVFAAALACGKPLVIDADALNLLAAQGLDTAPPGSVLTPHPGEAARLLGGDTAAVQADRRAALLALARHGAVAVLKGAGTMIAAAGVVPSFCRAGNPGMASGGMGDVLTGAIAGILAQCGDPLRAARAGVLAHALAGDALASRLGPRGLLASQVAEGLTLAVNRGE